MVNPESSAVEFLSRCWVPIIHLESRFMFAYGNTLMEDFLSDLRVSDAVDILMLGVGDIRYMLKTVAGLETRPVAAGCPTSLGYDIICTSVPKVFGQTSLSTKMYFLSKGFRKLSYYRRTNIIETDHYHSRVAGDKACKEVYVSGIRCVLKAVRLMFAGFT